MTYTLPDDAYQHLIDELAVWVNPKEFKATVRQWQQLAGWLNWGLNVYPLLRPALNNFYDKLRGQTKPRKSLWVTNAVRNDLKWARDKLVNSSGLFFLDSIL